MDDILHALHQSAISCAAKDAALKAARPIVAAYGRPDQLRWIDQALAAHSHADAGRDLEAYYRAVLDAAQRLVQAPETERQGAERRLKSLLGAPPLPLRALQ